MGTELRFRWLGVAGVELAYSRETLLIDPFLTRPPFRRLWLGRVEPDHALIAATLKKCDHILVSHAHYDHLMDVPDVAMNTAAEVFGSPNTCALLRACGVPDRQIQPVQAGDRLQLGSFGVEILTSQHAWTPGYSPGQLPAGLKPPLRLKDYVMDTSLSFRVRLPGLTLLFWYDDRVRSAPQADVLCVVPRSVDGYLATLLNSVQPQLVIPVHWDNLFRPLGQPIQPYFEPPRRALPPLRRVNLRQFSKTVERYAPGIRVLIPEVLKYYAPGL